MNDSKRPDDGSEETPDTDATERRDDAEMEQDRDDAPETEAEASEPAPDDGIVDRDDDEGEPHPESTEDPAVARAASEGMVAPEVMDDDTLPEGRETETEGDDLPSSLDATTEATVADDAAELLIEAGAPAETVDGPSPDAAVTGAAAAGAAGAGAAAAMTRPEPQKEIVRETVVEKRGGMIPGLVGGLLGGLAFMFGAPYVVPQHWLPPANVGELESRVAEIGDRANAVPELASSVESLSAAVSEKADASALAQLSAARDELAATTGDLASRFDGVQSSLTELSDSFAQLQPRIDDLERRPIAESPDPTAVAAVQSYAREVEALRAEVSDQMARSQEILDEAIRRSGEAKAEAERLAAEAAEKARQTAIQQAVVELQSAIESGEPFEDALGRLQGEDIPESLTAVAAEGVPTLPALQEAFPAEAREALAISRETLAGDDPTQRGVSFLQRQLGLRSLKPRDGDSVDAILSRAEDAVVNGNLSAAVSELEALPEAPAASVSDWVGRAQARIAAVEGADALAARLTPN